MNIADIGYERIQLEGVGSLTEGRAFRIGDLDDRLCDVCVDINDPLQSINKILEKISEDINSDSDIYISSMIGFNKNFLDPPDFIQKYIDFFCLLFRRIIISNKRVNFLQIGTLNSPIIPLFEGIAFSCEYECNNLHAKTLKISSKLFPSPAQLNRVWLSQYKSFLITNDNVYVKKYIPIKESNDFVQNRLKHAGIYVITGGNGGIGFLISKWLVEKYQARVILIGRRELNEEQKKSAKNIGVSAYIGTDVSDYEELEKSIGYIRDYYGHVDGIFHLAGVIKDKLLRNYESRDVNAVISPKIYGVLNLFKISQKIDLGFVCLFSSISGIIGNIGQAVYSAANAYMDDFCSYLRNEKNDPNWFSINWGAWASDGMQMQVKSSDVELMSAEECFRALEYLLNLRNGRFAIWNGNPSLLEQRLTHKNKIEEGNEHNFAFKEAIQAWVYECIRKFSGFSKIDFDQSIIDLGLDSVELINITVFFENEIRKHIPDYKLSKALLFECFSINKITSFFLETLSSKVLEYITGISLRENTKKQEYDNSGEGAWSLHDEIDKQHILEKFSNTYNDEDIAIVGIAGEFPEVVNVSEFEKILSNGICAIRVIPKDRWDWKRYYSQDKRNKNSSYCRHGGFMKNAAGFDNAFFKITPFEAIKIDPQERKFLQVAYHALEDGGYFATLDKRVGVFVAAMCNHYQNFDNADLPIISNSPASIANRLSFFMNFNGPSVCVDSMCSGSLTALNLAINSIALGECSSAVVGGVNIMPRAGKYIALSQAGFLSPTGKCQSFGIGADGYVPGEGIISIFIKKLGNAIADGNKVYGIIKGIAVNSVGTSSGYTVPSISAQADVINNALNKAAINPEDITYIETHGTGTSLGDPIEIEGIKSAYGSSDSVSKQSTCWLGAVKSNIGHLESAAGLAGLVKIILQFQNKKIYPNLFSSIENPELSLDKTRFKLAKSAIEWNGQYAGLSAFGAGGSNAHIIMQRYEQNFCDNNVLDSYMIPLSAKTDEALSKRISDLLLFVENTDYDLYSLSYTLCCARQHFEKRICYLVRNKNELLENLRNRKVEKKPQNDLIYRYVNNESVDFSVLFSAKSIQRLPSYPFIENTYWLNFDRTEEKEKFEYSLLAPHYLDVGDISNLINHNELYTLYINAPYFDSEGYFIVDRKDAPSDNKSNIFIIDYKSAKDWDKVFKKFQQTTLRVVIFEPVDSSFYSYEDLLHIYYTIATVISAQRFHFEILIVAFKNPKTETEKIQHSIYGLFRGLSLEKSNIKVVMLERDVIKPENLKIIKSFDHRLWENQDSLCLYMSDDECWKYSFQEISLSSTAQRLKNKGVYLITGGMGSIGLFLAKFLRRKYDARLVLLGRSEISEDLIKESFGDLYDGDYIHYISTDIEHLEQVRNAINESLQCFEKINGIIHSAGQIHDALFDEKKENEFLSTISVKAKGAEYLDICTAGMTLDFFACFSSLAAITGNVGQADYITANNYLDIFARSRNKQVRDEKRKGHTISINWPLWINHAKDHSTLKDYLKESLGIDILSEADGVELFDLIINNVPEDIDQIVPLPGKVLLNDFLKYAGYYSSKPESKNSDSLEQKFPEHEIDLDDVVYAVNQVTNNQLDINLDLSFGEIGLNSIMLQELAQRLGDQYSVPLPVLILFKYNSVNKLFRYLNEKLHKKQRNIITPAAATRLCWKINE